MVVQNDRELPPQITELSSSNSMQLDVPPGYNSSVILKLTSKSNGKDYYVWWVVAGRHGTVAAAVTASVIFDSSVGQRAIRFDVPAGTLLSTSYLQRYLELYYKEGSPTVVPPTPEDTPIIRG